MFSFTVSDSSVISCGEDGWEDKAGRTSKPGLVSPDYCVPRHCGAVLLLICAAAV